MKKIIIGILTLFSFIQGFSQANDTTKYIYYPFTYGNALDRYYAKHVLMIPRDTVWSKDGVAQKGGVFYIGNGTSWSQITGTGGTTDTLVFATWLRLYKTIDSMKAVNDARYKLKGDSVVPSGYTTIANKNKQADSIMGVVAAALAGKQPTGAYITSLTGPITGAGPGATATTIIAHAVTNANIVQMPTRTVKANITGGTADQVDVPIDTLASRITPDSFRIYRKPGSDSVFACVTPVATGIEKCVFQYHDSIGTGTIFDSLAAQGGNFHTDGFNQLKYRQLKDTTNQTGVPLLGRMYKSAIDSMKAVNDLRYKLGSDSTAVTGYRTGFALDDSIYQKDPFSWQMSIVSPLSDSATVGYRQDAPSIVRLPNGNILVLWAVFPTTDVSDNGPCRIYKAISTDNGRTWGSKGIAINNTLSNHISTPSLYVQPNGNIICIANFKAFYAAVPTVGHTGANFYRYKSTDNGLTFTLMDSLFASVTTYNYTSAGRIAQSIRTKRLFLPFGKQTTVIGHYLGSYFYSDDFGETWTQSGNTITPTDTLVNEPGIFIAQNNAPNDTSSGVERMYYFWTNTISPVPIKSVQSTDNGATISTISNMGIPDFAAVAAFTGINSETEVVGLMNRFFVSNTTGQGITRKYMDIVSSIDGGRSFRRLTNLVGWDSGYHYFEPAWVYDSLYGNMLAAISRMNDPQSRSDIRFYRIPTRTIINSYNYDPPQFTVGADSRIMSTSPASILQIYSRDRDNKYSVPPTAYLNFGSASGTANTFWPWINSAASTDFNGGLFISPKIGADGNAAYYSGAVAINASTAAGGTIATQPLFRVSNNTSTKFSVGPDGKTAIGSDTRVAWFSLPAGSATAGTAPIQFTAGPPTTTPVSGQLQSNTGLLIFDSSATVRDTLETRSHARGSIASVASGGAYVPTLGTSTNVTAVTLTDASYSISGSTVRIMIRGTFTATTINTISNITFTLPVTASSTSNSGGQVTVSLNAGVAGYASGQTALSSTTQGIMAFQVGNTSSTAFSMNLEYQK